MKILYLPILIISLVFCSPACSQSKTNVNYQSALDFKNSIAKKSVVLVDVRTAAEYNAGYIPNAINIDVYSSDFLKNVKALLKPTNELALYCRSGRRSKLAASKLADLNITTYELNNGFNEWLQAGFSMKK